MTRCHMMHKAGHNSTGDGYVACLVLPQAVFPNMNAIVKIHTMSSKLAPSTTSYVNCISATTDTFVSVSYGIHS